MIVASLDDASLLAVANYPSYDPIIEQVSKRLHGVIVLLLIYLSLVLRETINVVA